MVLGASKLLFGATKALPGANTTHLIVHKTLLATKTTLFEATDVS